VRIVTIVISRSRRRDGNFVDEFHAQSRGIRGKSWTRWLFGKVDWRVRRGRERTNRRRRVWEYSTRCLKMI